MTTTRRGFLTGTMALAATGCTVVCDEQGTCYVVDPIWENERANRGETPATMLRRLTGGGHGGTVGWLQDGAMLTSVGDDQTEHPSEWVFGGGESITFFEIIILDSLVAQGGETYGDLFRELTAGQDTEHIYGTLLRDGEVLPMSSADWDTVAQSGDIVVIYDHRDEIVA